VGDYQRKLTGFSCSGVLSAGALSSGDFSRFMGRLTGEDTKIGHFAAGPMLAAGSGAALLRFLEK
jgi:hypothetical protein